VPIVLKFGNLNLLEPSGPVQACNGIALPFMSICLFIILFVRLDEQRSLQKKGGHTRLTACQHFGRCCLHKET